MSFRGRVACAVCGCYPTAQTHSARDAAPWCDLADSLAHPRYAIHDHCAAYHYCSPTGCLTTVSSGSNVSPDSQPRGTPVMTDPNIPLPLVTGDELRDKVIPQPGPREMATRGLFVVLPKKGEQRQNYDKTGMEDVVIADVIIPGTGVFDFGAKTSGANPCPPRIRVTLPAKLKDVVFRGATIWDMQRAIGTAAVLGRIEQGTKGDKGNPPWLFNKPLVNDPQREAANTAYQQLAMAEYSTLTGINGWDVEAGAFPGAVGTAAPVAAPPAVPVAVPAQTSAGAMTWAQFQTLPAAAQAALTAAGQAPAAPVAATPAQVLPPGFTAATWATLDPAAQAATLQAFGLAAAATTPIPPAPPGFEGSWGNMTPEQRTQVLNALASQSPAAI